MRINTFQIVANQKKENETLVARMESAITTKGGIVTSSIVSDDGFDDLEIADEAQCVISVGGDGTLIATAQKTVDADVPLVGVNGGHLGYLCDLDENSVFEAIPILMEGSFEIERRMMIEGYIRRKNGEKTKTIKSLNDIVVYTLNGLGVVNLSVYVADEFLYSFNGDGMIFATPTGSTAYNLSANGPIVDPKTDVILMTPINAHTLTARSIVLDRRDEVSLEINPRRSGGEETVGISCDGAKRAVIGQGDRLVVRRSLSRVEMVRLSRVSFLERIRYKMASE